MSEGIGGTEYINNFIKNNNTLETITNRSLLATETVASSNKTESLEGEDKGKFLCRASTSVHIVNYAKRKVSR